MNRYPIRLRANGCGTATLTKYGGGWTNTYTFAGPLSATGWQEISALIDVPVGQTWTIKIQYGGTQTLSTNMPGRLTINDLILTEGPSYAPVGQSVPFEEWFAQTNDLCRLRVLPGPYWVTNSPTATAALFVWTLTGVGAPITTGDLTLPFTPKPGTNTVDVSCNTPDVANTTLSTTTLPIVIEEVISDQIANNSANKLPTSYYGDHPNNPMLMATTSGTTANLRIKANAPTAPQTPFMVGVRTNTATFVLSSTPALPSPQQTPLSFAAYDGSKTYEIVGGFDNNGNGSLEQNEVSTTFMKTPLIYKDGVAYTNVYAHLVDRIVIATQNDFNTARQTSEGYGGIPYNLATPTASQLVDAFARGANICSAALSNEFGFVLDASVIPSADGLSHPLGAMWAVNNQASTHRLVFGPGSGLAEQVIISEGIRKMVVRGLLANANYLMSVATSTWDVYEIPYTDEEIDFADSDKYSDPHAALGKCKFAGTLLAAVRSNADGIEVDYVLVDGALYDLYDFAYGGAVINIPLVGSIDPKFPARTQAGYATLTFTPWPDAGRVFFTIVEISSAWIEVDWVYPESLP